MHEIVQLDARRPGKLKQIRAGARPNFECISLGR